jgi:hypothetical protein
VPFAECALVIVDVNTRRTTHAHFAHLTGNQRRVRRNAAARRENPFSRDHATQIFRRRFDPGEHDFFAPFRAGHSFFGTKHDVAACRTRSSGKTGSNLFCVLYGLPIKDWCEQM